MRTDIFLNPSPGDTYDYDGSTFVYDGEHWVDDADGDTFWVSELTPPPCDITWSAVYYWYKPSENTISKYNSETDSWLLVDKY